MINKILIANRGEIACRVMRTCRELGIRTVAVYSTADVQSRHVQEADEAILLGEAPARDSYLNIAKVIEAAVATGADAIHPGYGFLAENGAFARACVAAGITFIGPTADVIEIMGNKRAAKALAVAHDVPILPSYGGADQSDRALQTAAAEIGYPLMVKAAAGGGGKGMRLVHHAEDLIEALAAARREGLHAFASDELLLEKALLDPRHIEIQLFGDHLGHVIHLGERDCSIQRRHQKIVEEAPAVGVSPALRERMGGAAVRLAQAAGYTNAGTVEFLLDGEGRFYFLEMNTRIQVEHPVTEMVTGQDLVAWQIKVAEGGPLPLKQDEVVLQGHAIEVRVYAEDPARDFLPVTGEIGLWRPFEGAGLRVDSGLLPADHISIHYDPMIAKVIAHSDSRVGAIRKLTSGLARSRLLGLRNNLPFLQVVLSSESFQSGRFSTRFIEQHFSGWAGELSVADEQMGLVAAAVCRFLAEMARTEGMVVYWRESVNQPLVYHFAEWEAVSLWPQDEGVLLTFGEQRYEVVCKKWGDGELLLLIDGRTHSFTVQLVGDVWWVAADGGTHSFQAISRRARPQSADSSGSLCAPMQGIVLAVLVEVGDAVSVGQPLVKMEAMKMEHTIKSTADGVVDTIYFQAGDQVESGVALIGVGAAEFES